MKMSQYESEKQCLSCGTPLPEGEWYKCDICQQIELGLIDKEDAPFGYID